MNKIFYSMTIYNNYFYLIFFFFFLLDKSIPPPFITAVDKGSLIPSDLSSFSCLFFANILVLVAHLFFNPLYNIYILFTHLKLAHNQT